MNTDSIVDVRIHPAIGIARVGGSTEEFYIGPEIPIPTGPPPGGYRDPQGYLKRQAARFRIFGYDCDGKVVGELTSANAEITWTVHVANKKSGWYQYDAPLDVHEASGVQSARRNSTVKQQDRENLIIDPGKRTISGNNQAGVPFDSGKFFGRPVYLGELRTDEAGRLLFLGGLGKASAPFLGYTLVTFNNNPGWHDDISDGPVDASVKIADRVMQADAAWVVTAPPAYAPDVTSPVTMYDLIYDTLAGTTFQARTTPRFTEEILPIFEQFSRLQWVNTGFFVQFGWRGPNDFMRPDFLARLAQAGNEFEELRRQIFFMFRNPEAPAFQALQWPQVYGDALGAVINGVASPRNGMSLTATQYGYLTSWMEGKFEANYDLHAKPPQSLADYPLQDQPDTLDRAALTFCLGGPFHPGCEMTWPMRRYSMYRGTFRLRRHPEGWDYPDYGEFLTPSTALAPSGPLSASGPGDITRWMSVPWHADTASCQQGYPGYANATLFNLDPYLPTFWPARSPNEVLAEEDYRIVMDQAQPLATRVSAFNRRVDWVRTLGPVTAPFLHGVTTMVRIFDQMGVVERRPGPEGDANFPAEMYVEKRAVQPPPAPYGEQPKVAAVAKVERDSPRATMTRTFMETRFGRMRRV